MAFAKTKSPLTSGEWASGKTLLNYCRRKDHPPDVPNKTIEQHALFEHIIGIWRSAIIGKIDPNKLIGCLSITVDSDYFAPGHSHSNLGRITSCGR
ncbi:MAG TPA: hypothetical protein VHW72_19320 [Candidatus Angelobacter sp.]|nr:hypothetical protein [Candidatus Angelobacter sp.]